METTTGSVSLTISGVLAPPTYSSISTYPYNTVVLIETKIPDDPFHFKEGSGVVIGPHTILTASHMLWDSTHQSEANQVWLYPGYYQNGIPNPAGSLGPIKANLVWHNYIVGVPGQNLISQSDSQYDFAVIDTDYTFTSWMNVLVDYGGGTVHVTGYPGIANGIQTDNIGGVTKDPRYSLLDYPNGFVSPGNSGGPLWLEGSNSVVGLVSTGVWGPQLTASDWNTILAWENADSYLWASPTVIGSGDFNSNGNPDFVWSRNSFLSMWEYNPTAQTVSNTSLHSVLGWGTLGSGHFSNANGSNAGTSQMLAYGPNGTMALWWVNSGGQLTGIDLGQRWPNIGYLTAGQFTDNGGANITNFLVTNLVDHHLYDWWIGPDNALAGIDLGPAWINVAPVAAGQFTANGGTNFLVSNTVDHHLYDWWIGPNNALVGIDLGPAWFNVAPVAVGQFTANGGANLLVTNTVDNHLYDWWIGPNNALTGIDLGAAWGNIQLVTAGRFDNNTTNTEMLVTNTVDHHLYEWWISPQGQLVGIDLGAAWGNVQLIGKAHYNNNSAFDELLVRNTVDGHFYEWWIGSGHLTGVDLGAVPGGSAGAAAGDDIAAANLIPLMAGAAPIDGGASPSAGSSPASSPTQAGLSPVSSDSTSLLVQSMASFGASDAAVNPTGAILSDGVGHLSEIVTPNDQRLAHG